MRHDDPNPRYLRRDVFNPIDVEAVVAGDYPAKVLRSAEKAAVCQRLRSRGMSAPEIAATIGLSERHTERLLRVAIRPQPAFDISDQRAEHLEDVLADAQRFAAEVREDAASLWAELCDMDAQRVRELLLALAAMVPIDASASRLLAWIDDELGSPVAEPQPLDGAA